MISLLLFSLDEEYVDNYENINGMKIISLKESSESSQGMENVYERCSMPGKST